MPPGAQRLDLDLLNQFPWLQTLPSHHRIVPNGSPYAPFLQVADQRIVAGEQCCLDLVVPPAGPTITGAFGLDTILVPGHALLQSIMANRELPSVVQKVSQLTTFLLRYRLFDVLEWISSPNRSVTPCGQPFKYPIPDPKGMRYKGMANWPNALLQGLRSIQEISYFDDGEISGNADLDAFQGNVTAYLFNSLASRVQQTDGHSIICNFECAALYLNILYQLDDPKADIPTTAEDFRGFLRANIPSSNWDAFFRKLLKTQTFKVPLHMALAISPVCLFLPSQLMFKDLNRLCLLLMWQGLGGPRPESLQLVELKIFRALVDVASQSCMPRPRFLSLFQELRAMNFASVSFTDGMWLAADPQFFANAPREYYAPASPSEIPIPLPLAPPPSFQGTMQDNQRSMIPEGFLEAPSIQHEEIDGDSQTPQHIPGALPDPRLTTGYPRPAFQELPYQRPKRSKKGLAIVHQTVDLSAEREVIPVHEIGALSPNGQTYRVPGRCFGGPQPFCCAAPEFHSVSERAMFLRLWDVATKPHPEPTPQWITATSSQLAEGWSVSDIQSALRERDIVITEIPGLSSRHARFDEPNLKTIASLQRIISAKDFSLPLNERGVHVLMKTMLDAASASPPKIIRSDYFPVPDVLILTPRGVSSDTMAWDATINQPCSGYEDFHVAVHGFGVYLEILVGSLWLLIGRKDGMGHIISAVCLHLFAGMGIVLRPGTPFYSLATSNCILRGSYWYASSSLAATATSIIHDFLASDSPSSTTDKGARMVLRRLAHFYHMVYTSGLFFSARESDECAHSPDVTTMEGLQNLLSLCNLLELGNILAGDDYTRDGISEPERQEIIEARRLCRRMVDWIRRHFMILDPSTQQEQSLNDDVWMPYLARYVKVIQQGKTRIVGVLSESFGSNAMLQNRISSLDLSIAANPLVFPGFSTLQITLRRDILADDQGEVSGENPSDEKHHRVMRSLMTT